MSADHGRTAVYAAEESAFDGTDLETVVALDLVVALGSRLVASGWWPGPAVAVRPARSDARSSRCAWRAGATTILDLLAANGSLSEAEAELVQAQFTTRLALTGLEAILGRRLFGTAEPEGS